MKNPVLNITIVLAPLDSAIIAFALPPFDENPKCSPGTGLYYVVITG